MLLQSGGALLQAEAMRYMFSEVVFLGAARPIYLSLYILLLLSRIFEQSR